MTLLGKTYQSVNSFNFSLFLRKGAVAVRGTMKPRPRGARCLQRAPPWLTDGRLAGCENMLESWFPG